MKQKTTLSAGKTRKQVMVEVQPLSNYVKSAEEHQNHLEKFPEDYYLCHVPPALLNKYKK